MAGHFFKRSLRGYDPAEVEAYINSVDEETNKLRVEVDSLRGEFEHAVETLAASQLAGRMREEVESAKEAAARILNNAETTAAETIARVNEAAREESRKLEGQANLVRNKGERALALRDNMLADMRDLLLTFMNRLDRNSPQTSASPGPNSFDPLVDGRTGTEG